MTEYVVRLANDRAVHSIQIDDGKGWRPAGGDFRAHELVLNERPGRTHQSYVRGVGAIKKIYNSLLFSKKEPDRNRI